MMLHSRARFLRFIPRRLPHALIITAGLSVAGCGGRFFETPTGLSRSLGASPEETPGHASIEDTESDSSTGVRAGARRFLATLFRRDTSSPDELDDPFLDTPVFAHAETTETPPGVAHAADDPPHTPDPEISAARVTRPRTIVRPQRRSETQAQPEIDEAASRMAEIARNMNTERPRIPDADLPEWARPAAEPQLAQQQDDTSPWAREQTRVAATAGRVRIGRLESQHPLTETAPQPSRRIESLLAAREAETPHTEPTSPAWPPAVARRPVSTEERATAPAAIPPAAPPTQPAGVIAQQDTRQGLDLPPWAIAPSQHQAMGSLAAADPVLPAESDPTPDVRDLPTHFENILALAESPALESARRFTRDVSTTSAATSTENWESATIAATDEPISDLDQDVAADATDDSPFPVLNEWRGVGANMPVEVAERGDWDTDEGFDIHQTAFESQSGEGFISPTIAEGIDVAATPGLVTVAPTPPADAPTGIRVFGNASDEREESGSRLPWFVALLVAMGLGVFAYRRHLQHRDS